MTSDQYISVRETAQILGVSEKKIMDLIEEGKLQAYRIAGQFLRLKKTEVLALRSAGEVESENVQYPYRSSERIRDFLYFNDFYIISLVAIAFLIFTIFRIN